MMLCGVAVFVWTNTQPGIGFTISVTRSFSLPDSRSRHQSQSPHQTRRLLPFRRMGARPRYQRALHGLPHWLDSALYLSPARRCSRGFPSAGAAFRALCAGLGRLQLPAAAVFVRFSYNVFFHWFAELALLPAGLLAFVIFRSRLRGLKNFTLNFFQAKAGAFRLTPLRGALGARPSRHPLCADSPRSRECLLRHRAQGDAPGSCRRSGEGPGRLCQRGRCGASPGK